MDKYTVLIADDEFWIRDSLKKMLEESKFDFYVPEPAKDGLEAVKRAEEEKPDIILTDINMPGINGIQLIQMLKEKSSDIEIIVISGYQDFEYVRDALVFGAIDYLLKPINLASLEAVLEKAAMNILHRDEDNQKKSVRQKDMLRYSSYLQDQEYSLMVSHYDSFAVIENQISELELDYVGYCLVLVNLSGFTRLCRNSEGKELHEEIYKIKEYIRKKLSGSMGFVFHNIYVSDEFVIICDSSQNEMHRLGEELARELPVREKCYCTVGISRYTFSWKKIKEVYLSTKVALLSKEYRNYNYVGIVDEEEKTEGRKRISPEQERNLIQSVRIKNRKEILSILEDIHLADCGKEKWSFLEVKQTVNKIAWIFMEDEEVMKNQQKKIEMEYLFEYLNMVLENYNIHIVFQVLEEMADKLLEQSQDIQDESESIQDIVFQCQEYIKNHFYEDLSLSGLSEKYHVSAPYFSKAFKQVSGENLMSYISRVRMEKAIQYMEQGISLTDIAERVGYDDYSYFNRVFRKITGKGPREYKAAWESAAHERASTLEG